MQENIFLFAADGMEECFKNVLLSAANVECKNSPNPTPSRSSLAKAPLTPTGALHAVSLKKALRSSTVCLIDTVRCTECNQCSATKCP